MMGFKEITLRESSHFKSSEKLFVSHERLRAAVVCFFFSGVLLFEVSQAAT